MKSNEEKLIDYISHISKKVDIDNCKTMVNVAMLQNFTTKSLIQYCEEHQIPYFKRDQYDIFTLEEYEYLKFCADNGVDIDNIYIEFTNKFNNRYKDIDKVRFKQKIEKLNLYGKEEKDDMRFTNEVVEYVKNISQDFPKEKLVNIINMAYSELQLTEEKLEEMGAKYNIEFYKEGQYGIFTLGEFKTFMGLMKTCKDMKELYELFSKKYPKFTSYDSFCKEADKLEVMKMYREASYTPKEKTIFFNKEEDEYILQGLKDKISINELYTFYNKKFSSKIGGLYSTKLGFTEFKRKCIEMNKKLKDTTKFDENDLELLSKLANGERTLKQIITEFENISSARCTEAQFRYALKKLNVSVKREEVAKVKQSRTKYTKEFIDELRELSKTNTAEEVFNIVSNKYPELNATKKVLYMLANRNGFKYITAYKGRVSKKVKQVKQKSSRGLSEDYINYIRELAKEHTSKEAAELLKDSKWAEIYSVTEHNLNNIRSRYKIKFKSAVRGRVKKVHKSNENLKYNFDEISKLAIANTLSETVKLLNKIHNTDTYTSAMVSSFARKNNIKFYERVDFDEEDIKYINELKESGITQKRPIFLAYCKKFPCKFRMSNFYKLLDNYDIYVHNNFPHLSNVKGIVVHSTDGTAPIAAEKAVINENIELQTHPNIQEENGILELEQQQNDMSKYQPIIDEVETVFERKCKQLNKTADTYLHTQQIVEVLRLLQSYAKNTTNLTSICNDHEDILEQYVREVEHEIENMPFQDTDTTLQNKIKVIRMRRREVKQVKEDIDILSPLLNVIKQNPAMFNNVIMDLEQKVKDRQDVIFIPVIDTDMVKRHDWCKQGSLWSKKVRTPILTTNKKLSKKNMKKYRVKAEYMAFGNSRPFTDVYYDVFATGTDEAREKSTAYFDKLSKEHNNSKYTIQDIYTINI